MPMAKHSSQGAIWRQLQSLASRPSCADMCRCNTPARCTAGHGQQKRSQLAWMLGPEDMLSVEVLDATTPASKDSDTARLLASRPGSCLCPASMASAAQERDLPHPQVLEKCPMHAPTSTCFVCGSMARLLASQPGSCLCPASMASAA